ncbi:MAG: hypothetical protein ACE5EL_05190 [Anaerolineae bacterium]
MTPPRTVVALALVAVTWVGVAAGAQGSAAIPLASGGRSECRRGFSAGVLALAWSFPVAVVRGQGPVGPAEPEVVADGNGGLHAVWIDYRKGPAMPAVMYARRDPAGAWGPAEEVRGAEAMVAVTDPQVAVDAMGQVHAVWAETRGADPDVYASLRGQGGAWRAPYRVNDDAGGAWQETPRALGDLWGNLHVVWTDYRQGNADIYHSRIRPGGRPGRNVRVNEPAGGDQTEPRLALTPGGDLHAVWQDTRAGSADIYASMVPHAGLSPELADADVVWWPNARLNSEALVDRQTAPAVVAGAGGEVRAVWVDADSRLRTAVLTPAEPFWQPDTPLYDAGAARLSAPRLAVDPSGAVVVAWLTTAGGGTGVWSAVISAAGLGEASRIDDTPITRGAEALALAVGPLSIAHVLWAGPSRFGGAAVYYSAAQMPPPDYRRERHRGWLTYIPGRMNCAGDGFLLRTCGGETGPFVRLPSVPANFIGRWVEAEGTLVAGTRCPVLRADKVVLATAPCPDDSGAITGVVRRLGVPMPGARVSSGGKTATTGVSGRFFLEGLPGGSHDLVLEAPCALEATLVGARVQAGFTLVGRVAEGGAVGGG